MDVSKCISARALEAPLEPFRLALALPKDVIRLSVGEPDFDTPDFVREAAEKAIEDRFTHYSPSSGFEELRKAVAEELRRDNGINYDFESEIVITPGSSSGIFLVMLSLHDPGDEALVPYPAWFHYATLVRLCGAKPVGMPVEFKDNASSLDLEETERRLTDGTKVLIIIATSMIMGFVSVSCTHSKTIGYQKPR